MTVENITIDNKIRYSIERKRRIGKPVEVYPDLGKELIRGRHTPEIGRGRYRLDLRRKWSSNVDLENARYAR